MTRTDFLGVTSIIRGLGFLSGCYEKLILFFRSESYSTDEVRRTWFHSVRECGHLFRFEGRAFLIRDGTKQSKEGRYMPGVKKLYQESENSSKPEYIIGHMFGGIGVLLNRSDTFFCTPLCICIHDGLSETATWNGGELSRTASLVMFLAETSQEMIRCKSCKYKTSEAMSSYKGRVRIRCFIRTFV